MRQLLLGCVVFLLFTSCSKLQYRLNDDEIKTQFTSANVPTQISYIAIDSLDRSIRVQSVTQDDNSYNIIFLHGSPSSMTAWRNYLKDSLLITRANLHAIDRPGYGYSDFGKALVSIETQGEVINRVIKDLKLNNVIAIGASYGGAVAARIATNNKEVKGVVMVSPAIDPQNEQRIWQSDFTQYWLTRWLVPTGYRVAGDEKTTHAQELARIEKDWDKVTVPVMHIHGDADDLVPYVNVDYTKRVFSDSEIITIPKLGHEIAWRHPKKVIPYILQMIDKIDNQ